MISVLINWVYIILTTYIVGNACLRLLEFIFRRHDKNDEGNGDNGRWRRTPFYDLFAGIMCTTCYAQVYSLFAGVSVWANIAMLIFCVVYIIFFRKKILQEFADYIKTLRKEMPAPVKRLLICALILGSVVYALASSGAPKLIDTDWYHAQTIRWIEEYGCVKGVSNLFYSLAFNSAQHYFDALYSMKAVLGASMHATGGYFGLLLLFHGLIRIAGFKGHKRHIADALALAEVVYTIIVTAFYADPYTDTLPNCLVFFILTEWLILIEDNEEDDFPYAFLCIFGVFATVVKTSAVIIVLLVIKPAIKLIKNKEWVKTAGYISTGVLVAVPFFMTNVRVSGYLVYLATAIDIFDVPWKIDIEIVKYAVASMIHDARAVNATMEEALHSGLSWVPVWFKNESVSHRILYVSVAAMLLFDIISTVLSAVKKKTLEISMLLPRAVVVIGLIYWFFTIPQVKYCWVFLLFPLTVVPAIWLEKSGRQRSFSRASAITAAFMGGAVLLMFTGFYTLRTLGYVRDAVMNNLLVQEDYAKFEMKPVQKNGQTFYVREEGGDIVCGYYVFPYLNEEELLDRLVVGEELSDGFYLE